MSLTGQTLKQRKDEGIVATTATDTALLITQEQDGSVAKPIELKNLLTDRKDTILGQELPETLSGITLAHNPLRAKPVMANDDNTKAYAGLPVLPNNTAVAMKKTALETLISVPDNTNINFSNKSFSFAGSVKIVAWYPGQQFIFSKGVFGETRYVFVTPTTINKKFMFLLQEGTISQEFYSYGVRDSISIDRSFFITATVSLSDASTTVSFYINNIFVGSDTKSVVFNTDNIRSLFLGANEIDKITLHNAHFFNYALTPAEVSLLWNNGRPDRAILHDYMKWGDNADITSGTLTIGKRYLIKTYLGTDDFTNVATVISGTINTDGCIFETKATTPTDWTSESVLIQLGSVASYTGKGLITDSTGKCTSWETDKKIETGTDDGLTATITGTPDLQLIQAEKIEGQGLVDSIYKTITTAPMSANGLIGTVPMGWVIDEVLIEKTAGSTSNSIVIRANSTSGTQIGTCSAIAFADSDDDLYTVTMTKKKLSNTANKDVFVSGISAGTYVATLRIKKV